DLDLDETKLHPERASRRRSVRDVVLPAGIRRIPDVGHTRQLGYRFLEQLETLAVQGRQGEARYVSSRPSHAVDETLRDWIRRSRAHDDGDRRSRVLCGERGGGTVSNDDVDTKLHQLGGETGQTIEPSIPRPDL